VKFMFKSLIEKFFNKVIGKYSKAQNASKSVEIPMDYEEIFEGDPQLGNESDVIYFKR